MARFSIDARPGALMTLVNFSDRIKFREEGWKKIGALSPRGEINQRVNVSVFQSIRDPV